MSDQKQYQPWKVGIIYLGLLVMCLWYLQDHSRVIENDREQVMVVVKRKEEEIEIPLEEYIVGVVASEMPASFSLEALKAQSVASRTFVASRNYVVDDSTSSQVYKSEQELKDTFQSEYEEKITKIKEAVEATRGEVLVYQGSIISALFFSTSNGYTVSSQDYFTNELPYLQAVSSEWDLEVNENVIQSVTFTNRDLCQLLSCNGTIQIEIISRYEDHRVKSVKVNDTLYTGRELREKLSLRSTDFLIEQTGDSYIFTTIGYGHGVGMSQYGAQGMALEGYSYQEILRYYYQGVEIYKLY
ncbi:MAG: stage II sporulation protein D [Erysipelotrichales bacterium]|nr:stage II sporulation protein D [Erysipelotrichales bacterium]MBR3693493.1 stage II sporulation protein D [Erysipelotrichales bacterium]